jgi:predicted transcriptional regulator
MQLNRDSINTAVIGIVSALEAGKGEAPKGILYLGLQMSGYTLDNFHAIVELLVKSNVVTKTAGPQLKLTEKGIKLAATIKAEMG